MNKVSEVYKILDACLELYNGAEKKDVLLLAEEEFVHKTGKFNEEEDDYELRVNSFHDYLLFHFEHPKIKRKIIKDYLIRKNIDLQIESALLQVEFSLFEYLHKKNDIMYFKDLVTNETFELSEESFSPTFMPQDTFIGRRIKIDKRYIFTRGFCLIPGELKKKIVFEIEKRSLVNYEVPKNNFLIDLERLKTKAKNYSHLSFEEVFVFS